MNDTATVSAAFLPIAFERLSPEERRSADAYTLAAALADTADAALAVAAASIDTRRRLVEALTRTVYADGDRDALRSAKADALRERSVLASLGDRGRALRQLSSILQTLLRSAV